MRPELAPSVKHVRFGLQAKESLQVFMRKTMMGALRIVQTAAPEYIPDIDDDEARKYWRTLGTLFVHPHLTTTIHLLPQIETLIICDTYHTDDASLFSKLANISPAHLQSLKTFVIAGTELHGCRRAVALEDLVQFLRAPRLTECYLRSVDVIHARKSNNTDSILSPGSMNVTRLKACKCVSDAASLSALILASRRLEFFSFTARKRKVRPGREPYRRSDDDLNFLYWRYEIDAIWAALSAHSDSLVELNLQGINIIHGNYSAEYLPSTRPPFTIFSTLRILRLDFHRLKSHNHLPPTLCELYLAYCQCFSETIVSEISDFRNLKHNQCPLLTKLHVKIVRRNCIDSPEISLERHGFCRPVHLLHGLTLELPDTDFEFMVSLGGYNSGQIVNPVGQQYPIRGCIRFR